MGDVLRDLLDWLAALGPGGLCAAAFLFAAAETAIFADVLVPGEVGLALVGAAAERADFPLPVIIVAAALGATVGDCISFAVGRRWGTGLLERGDRVRVVERAHRSFARHAGAAVFFGRWVGVLRAVVPVVAGSSGMSLGRFLAWNVAASCTWTATVLTAAYVGGQRAVELIDRAGWIGLAAALVVAGAFVVRGAVRRRRRRPRPDGTDSPLHGRVFTRSSPRR